jgi:hypothetical protein
MPSSRATDVDRNTSCFFLPAAVDENIDWNVDVRYQDILKRIIFAILRTNNYKKFFYRKMLAHDRDRKTAPKEKITSGTPLAATMKSKNDTNPAASPGECGCTCVVGTRAFAPQQQIVNVRRDFESNNRFNRNQHSSKQTKENHLQYRDTERYVQQNRRTNERTTKTVGSNINTDSLTCTT